MDERAVRREQFPSKFESLDSIREFVGRCAEDCGLEGAAVYQVQLAVDEACSNIIEHAYKGTEGPAPIECTCRLLEAGLEVTLCDGGRPFDPQAVPDPDLNAELEERSEGGLGLYFMRQLMDEVEFTFTTDPVNGRSCNILRMVKRKEG